MQYIQALDRLLQETVFADPAQGHVYMLKADVYGGFYQICLRPADDPKRGLIFPVDDDAKPLVAIFLILLMGWKNSPNLFCTATETVSELANQSLRAHPPSRLHKLNEGVAAVFSAAAPTLDPTGVPLSRDPLLLLLTNSQLLAYVDVFIDDFLGLAQGPTHRCRHAPHPLPCLGQGLQNFGQAGPTPEEGSPLAQETEFM